MTVYVDALLSKGRQIHGRPIRHCHLFADVEDYDKLHAIAEAIGLKRAWFRSAGCMPHYDLTPGKRVQAIAAGAVPVGRSLAVKIWRARGVWSQEERAT